MFVTATLAAALAMQGASTSLLLEESAVESSDAAYGQLVNGEALAAVRQLETMRAAHPRDPAVLINLAAAYIEVGQLVDAREAYVAAIRSDERARLELADGSWVDSRNLARAGLARLENSRAWAMK